MFFLHFHFFFALLSMYITPVIYFFYSLVVCALITYIQIIGIVQYNKDNRGFEGGPIPPTIGKEIFKKIHRPLKKNVRGAYA